MERLFVPSSMMLLVMTFLLLYGLVVTRLLEVHIDAEYRVMRLLVMLLYMLLLLMFRHKGEVAMMFGLKGEVASCIVMILLPMVIILVVNGAVVDLTFVVQLLLVLKLVRIARSIVPMVVVLLLVLVVGVRVRFRMVESMMHCMLVEMNWLNIMLIIEAMVKGMVGLVVLCFHFFMQL